MTIDPREGETRTVVRKNHALLAPDGHVKSKLPGWLFSEVVMFISPEMGARFCMYLVSCEADKEVRESDSDPFERVIYLLEGELEVSVADQASSVLEGLGRWAYLPPNEDYSLQTRSAVRAVIFDKMYCDLEESDAPERVLLGNVAQSKTTPFMGDDQAMLTTLLPEDMPYDLAVNVFTFAPGASLPFVETHVMEHGLYMLEGQGTYRLDGEEYQVEAGDVIWMASYCPQWFRNTGGEPASYLYYKDVNRHPLMDLSQEL